MQSSYVAPSLAETISSMPVNTDPKIQEKKFEEAFKQDFFVTDLSKESKEGLTPLACAAKNKNIVALKWLVKKALDACWDKPVWWTYLSTSKQINQAFQLAASYTYLIEGDPQADKMTQEFIQEFIRHFQPQLYWYDYTDAFYAAAASGNLFFLNDYLNNKIQEWVFFGIREKLITNLLAKALINNRIQILDYLLDLRHELNYKTEDLPKLLMKHHEKISNATLLHCLNHPKVGIKDKVFVFLAIDHKDIKLFDEIEGWQIILCNDKYFLRGIENSFNEFVIGLFNVLNFSKKDHKEDKDDSYFFLHFSGIEVIATAVELNNKSLLQFFYENNIRFGQTSRILGSDSIRKAYYKNNDVDVAKILIKMRMSFYRYKSFLSCNLELDPFDIPELINYYYAILNLNAHVSLDIYSAIWNLNSKDKLDTYYAKAKTYFNLLSAEEQLDIQTHFAENSKVTNLLAKISQDTSKTISFDKTNTSALISNSVLNDSIHKSISPRPSTPFDNNESDEEEKTLLPKYTMRHRNVI